MSQDTRTSGQKGSLEIMEGDQDKMIFLVNPSSFNFSQSINYHSSTPVGKNNCNIDYSSQGPISLSFTIDLYSDVLKANESSKNKIVTSAFSFIEKARSVKNDKKSPPALMFRMPGFSFVGHLQTYNVQATSFGDGVGITGVSITFKLLGTGE